MVIEAQAGQPGSTDREILSVTEDLGKNYRTGMTEKESEGGRGTLGEERL